MKFPITLDCSIVISGILLAQTLVPKRVSSQYRTGPVRSRRSLVPEDSPFPTQPAFSYMAPLVSGYKSHRVNWLKLGLWDSCKPCFISS